MMNPSLVSAFLCCCAVTILLLNWRRRRTGQRKMQEARWRRDRALQQMEKAAGNFKQQNPSHQPAPILAFTLPQLCGNLRDGSLSPETVLCTYMDKALDVTREINCVTDYLENSESQLLHLKSQGKKGLLYGVPVSIKDSIDCKGHDSTLGLVKRLHKPATADAVVVQVLKQQGAIPFVKTNVPQSLLNYDCSNLIFGQTVHPMDHTKTPGGSSGGEASLIKSGGSILGIGTDVGGSIRIPAAFCGICGFKATGNRISKRGIVPSIRGQKSASPGVGPMARDVDGLVLCIRAILCDQMFQLDPTVAPLPFNEKVYSSSQPLRIGYYTTDSFTVPSPSMKRAVLETKHLLEKAGHTLVPFKPLNIEHVMSTLVPAGLFADGGTTFLESFQGESADPNIKEFLLMVKLPGWLKSFLSWIVRAISPRMSKSLRSMKEKSVNQLWKLHTEVEEYCHEFIAEWKRLNLDVVLCPALGPAFKIGFPGKISVGASYTILYNFLDFPAGVVPVTTVTAKDEEDLKTLRGHYDDIWDRTLKKAAAGAIGLPVAVQCVALPWQDELCLRFMKEVEKLTQEKQRKC
ncbi:fatty-acid amide hydrolase 1-like isoform X2 [Sphaerodactylus townsendi]|uniref:fatty-acid amide hydrolase 1-like isoform X2 n=1 Tax=Sphaerodactylus townsendi TaxID=933632 RepID=UPI00202646B2|nr:fatty-acid amide hydrolase 1-like isoform X2 [Sphaerodactylus townsendi]